MVNPSDSVNDLKNIPTKEPVLAGIEGEVLTSGETPVAETPVSETPVAETPVAETPVAETPVAETPAE